MIELRPLSADDMETVRVWRLGCPETLRTPYMLTKEMQQQYYRDVICNREGHTRYWGLWRRVVNGGVRMTDPRIGPVGYTQSEYVFIGYGGLENISWENGNAEISLLIGPEYRKQGYGREAVKLFLGQAFDVMRLHSVYGECYLCGPWRFWDGLISNAYGNGSFDGIDDYAEHYQFLPCRKLWNGVHYDSYYFTFTGGAYENLMRDTSEGDEQTDTRKKPESVLRETGDTVRDRVGSCDWVDSCGIE